MIGAFIERYNNGWLLKRHGYMTRPVLARTQPKGSLMFRPSTCPRNRDRYTSGRSFIWWSNPPRYAQVFVDEFIHQFGYRPTDVLTASPMCADRSREPRTCRERLPTGGVEDTFI